MSNGLSRWIVCPSCKQRFDLWDYTYGYKEDCESCGAHLREDIVKKAKRVGGSDTAGPNKTTDNY